MSSLAEAVQALNDPAARRAMPLSRTVPNAPDVWSADLADVRGQLLARRALEIASAGGHNLLLIGPPGAGKTMMARRLPGILPPLTFDEALEVTAVHSVAGLLPRGAGLLTDRPFRAPHHTISDVALIGGGAAAAARRSQPRASRRAVSRRDARVQPPRARSAAAAARGRARSSIARAARTAVFPARFVLVGAMNPCPCGFATDPLRECRCTPQQVARYRGRLSGPLRDRLDLTVEVPALPVASLTAAAGGEPSSAVRARVIAARHRQSRALCERPDSHECGADAGADGAHCPLDAQAARLLDLAVGRMSLSARGYDRVRKVARTIADLAGAGRIGADHIAEALQFRML